MMSHKTDTPMVELGSLVAAVRDEAGLTQVEMADRLKLTQTKISRLEKGDGKLSEYADYLEAVGTDAASRLRRIIVVRWKHLPQPSLRNPDLDTLVEIETALRRLEDFKNDQKAPQVLVGQADLLSRRLSDFGTYLINVDHQLIWVGEIGVGKTTAACVQTGLVTDSRTAKDLKGLMLDTGGGRTTLCDVTVECGTRYALHVIPLPDEEVYRLTADFCRGLNAPGDKKDGPTAADFKPAEEVERALRSMANLRRPNRKKGEPAPPDPAMELSKSYPDEAEFRAEVSSRLTLWRRTRRSIEFEGADDAEGRKWLKDSFTLINNGRHPEFSLPAKIRVVVPFEPVAGSPFNITITDTRGIDGSSIRPDLAGHLKNNRAVTILCSRWGSAPEPSSQSLLAHVRDTEADPTLLSRATVLVIARGGDALSMRHDDGTPAADAWEGYEIKLGHVSDALRRVDLDGVNSTAFDAANDDPEELTKYLVGRIANLRRAEADGALATVAAVDQMLENVKEAQALAALQEINNELKIFATRHSTAPTKAHKPVQYRLIDAVNSLHARTVWAATRRNGRFWNFNMFQHLGDGAAANAKKKCGPAISGLREIVQNRLANKEYNSASSFLKQLLADANNWEADFVNAARHHALAVFEDKLSSASSVWRKCENAYGMGGGYREDVAAQLEQWFEENDALNEKFERLLGKAWHTSIVEPLLRAVGEVEAEAIGDGQ